MDGRSILSGRHHGRNHTGVDLAVKTHTRLNTLDAKGKPAEKRASEPRLLQALCQTSRLQAARKLDRLFEEPGAIEP